ncbi:unnamed protein product [Rhizoctonia solani]|uniref:Transposase Tc1-like domain-containing protein n=1 Tax=Rhizoctonia solani TaxID=456999 RepID=A0A8H2WKH2_9AGAM|nr:unnamed protein product [Rhizoctonia solani]
MDGAFNRRYIPVDVKKMLLRLGAYIPPPHLSLASGVSSRTLRRINRLWDTTGAVVRVNMNVGRPRKLRPLDIEYMQSLLDHTPNMTSMELKTALEEGHGISVSCNTIDRACARADYTCKQLTRSALEANDQLKAAFVATVGNGEYTARQFIFVDKTCINRITPRRHIGRSVLGSRAC